jgi:AmmeMemoRadiSam system protein A
MNEETKKFILKIARKAIENYVKYRKIIKVNKYPKELEEKRTVFVTIYRNNELRGCIGSLADLPIIENLISAAVSACEDPRFLPLQEEELDKIKIEVSILSEFKRSSVEEIKEFKHGVYIKRGLKSAIFLPQVWYEIPNKNDFLFYLCIKGGINPKELKDCEIYTFEAEIIKEE